MRKITLCLMLFAGSSVFYCMEKRQIVRTAQFKTSPKILVVQDDIHNRHTKSADIFVIGEVEQRKKFAKLYDYGCVGDIILFQDNSEMAEPKHRDYLYCIEKKSKDVLGVFKIKKGKVLPPVVIKNLDGIVVKVVEPQLIYDKIDCSNSKGADHCKVGYSYCVARHSDNEKSIVNKEYYEDEALEQACKDLGMCYKNVLEKAHEFFTENHAAKSIAFTALSKSLGFPADKAVQVAIASVVEFIKQSPNKHRYGSIEFLVSNKKDFFSYGVLLETQEGLHCSSYDEESLFPV